MFRVVLRGLRSLLFLTLTLGGVQYAQGTTLFFTDEAAWQAAVVGSTARFDFTASNVARAQEVSTPPGIETDVGALLTFNALQTGLSTNFVLRTLQPGATLVFNDRQTGVLLPEFTNALSVGRIDAFEDDDWEIAFAGSGVLAVGIDLRDNDVNTGESFQVFGAGNVLLGSILPPTSSNRNFLGVIAMSPILRVVLDEGPGGDDIAIGGLQVATVPEPSTLLLLGGGLLGLLGYTWQQRNGREQGESGVNPHTSTPSL